MAGVRNRTALAATRIATLFIALATVPGTAYQGWASPTISPEAATELFQSIETKSKQIDEQLSTLTDQAQNPGSLWSHKQPAEKLHQELAELERLFASWQKDIETSLTLSSRIFERPGDDLDSKILNISNFFATLTKLANVRALLHETITSSRWASQYELSVPFSTLAKMSGFEQIKEFKNADFVIKMLTKRDSQVVLDMNSVQFSGNTSVSPNQVFKLKINNQILQTVETQAAANLPSDAVALKIWKYLGLIALYDEFSKVNLYRPNPGSVPPMPPSMIRDLGTMGEIQEKLKQGEQELAEPARRQATFAAALPYFQSDAAAFVTDDFVTQLLGIAKMGPPTAADIKTAALTMRAAEGAGFVEQFGRLMAAWPLPMYTMNAQETARALLQIAAKAKTLAVAPGIRKALAGSPLTEGQNDTLVSLIEDKYNNYADTVPRAPLEEAIRNVERSGSYRAAAKSEFVKSLLNVSSTLVKSRGLPDNQIGVDLKTLDRAFSLQSQSLIKEPLIESTKRWVSFVLSAGGYAESRALHAKAVAQIATNWSGKSQSGLINEKGHLTMSSIAALSRATAPDPKAAEHDPAAAPKLLKLSDEAAEGDLLKTQLHQILELGRVYGFYRETGDDKPPTLADLPLDENQKRIYRNTLENLALGNPILTIETGPEKIKLFERLAKTQDEAVATNWINQALEVEAGNIQRDIIAIADAKDRLGVIEVLGTSTLINLMMTQGFPTLALQQQALINHFVRAPEKQDIYQVISGEYSQPMAVLMPMFIAEFAVSFFRPTRPIVRVVNSFGAAISPFIADYFLSTIPIMVADVGYRVRDIQRAESRLRTVNDFFYTSTASQAIFDYFDVLNARDNATLAWRAMEADVGMNLAFLLSPMLAGAKKSFSARMAERRFEKLFAKIGMTKEHVSWSEPKIRAAADAKVAEILDGKAELSGRNLLDEVIAVRKAEAGLIKILNKDQRELELVIRDFQSEFRALGMAPGKETLNLGKLDAAFAQKKVAFDKGEIDKVAFEAAEKAVKAIRNFVDSQAVYLFPGPLKQMVYAVRNKYRVAKGLDPINPEQYWIRTALFQEVYDFWPSASEANAQAGVTAELREFLEIDNAYERLGLTEKATAAEIKKAHLKKALELHPDRNKNDPEAGIKFNAMERAYKILKDAETRAKYDAFWLERREASGK